LDRPLIEPPGTLVAPRACSAATAIPVATQDGAAAGCTGLPKKVYAGLLGRI
jgi:hypothetical protein